MSAAAAPSVENSESENEDWNLDDSHSEQHSAVTATDTEAGLVPELDPMVGIPPENNVGDGWPLYFDQYPPAYARSGSTSEDEELNWDWDWDLDDIDSNEDSAITGADEEAPNGEEHRSVPEIQAKEEARDVAGRPTGDRAASNGRGPQKTRTRTRRRRARSSKK